MPEPNKKARPPFQDGWDQAPDPTPPPRSIPIVLVFDGSKRVIVDEYTEVRATPDGRVSVGSWGWLRGRV